MRKNSVQAESAEIDSQQSTLKVEDNLQSANKHSDDLTQAPNALKHRFATLRDNISFQRLTPYFRFNKLFHREFTYPIDKDLKSPATRVMFNNNDSIKQQICLKMWRECNNGVYNTSDPVRRTRYLLEGLEFNRQFAPDIYLGIVQIIDEKKAERNVIKCGPLIREPANLMLDLDVPYALVMKRLDERSRLDHQLYTDANCLGNEAGMKFLAREVACMHRQFVESPIEMGTPKRLFAKLQFNRQRYHQALDRVRREMEHFSFRELMGDGDIHWLRSFDWLLEQVGKIHHPYYESFEQRHNNKHIRRCHGDLKATNLWICQASSSRSQVQLSGRRLIALDCVDFKPEFCHIDTLSDIAMLAVDLEMRLTSWSRDPQDQMKGRELAQLFLNTYLQEMDEKDSARLLLEYYLTEKAMVCMYMSILYDNLPSLGEKYLKVVLTHSQKLADYLPRKIGKRLTRPLSPLITGAASRHV